MKIQVQKYQMNQPLMIHSSMSERVISLYYPSIFSERFLLQVIAVFTYTPRVQLHSIKCKFEIKNNNEKKEKTISQKPSNFIRFFY